MMPDWAFYRHSSIRAFMHVRCPGRCCITKSILSGIRSVRYRTKLTQSGIFLVRYQTKIRDAGMPMPVLVSAMPMPSYGYVD
jgi:hypothetical protein